MLNHTVLPREDESGNANVTIILEWMGQKMVIKPETEDDATEIEEEFNSIAGGICIVMEEGP